MDLVKIAARLARRTTLNDEDFRLLKDMSTVCSTTISWQGDTVSVDMGYESPYTWWIGSQKYTPDDSELQRIADAYRNTPREPDDKFGAKQSEQALQNMRSEFGNVATQVLQEYYGDKAGW